MTTDHAHQGMLAYDENCDTYTHLLRDETGHRIIASTQQSSRPECEANARRLAACWNACQGISTKNLEENKPVIWLAQQYSGVIKQRDDLLDVAQAILAEDMLQYLPAEFVAKVRAAIAKATGEQS